MGAGMPNFRGRFTDVYGWFVDAKEYERKKDEAIKKLTEEKQTKEEGLREKFDDYKLKIRIDVEKFKSDWKDKFKEQGKKYMEQVKNAKSKLNDKLYTFRHETTAKQKQEEKRKYEICNMERCKLMYLCYLVCEKLNSHESEGKPYNKEIFKKLLSNELYLNSSYQQIVKDIKTGTEYLDNDQKFGDLIKKD